jgi:hypothetical protein
MRRVATIAATVAGALVLSLSLPGCDDLGAALDPDATLSTGATPASPVAPVPPRSGRALLGIDGDARADLVFGELTEPAVYAGGEGPLSLVWRTATYDLFTLGGDVRLGTQPTSTTLRVQLAVDLGRDVVAFASDDGSCSVTVERAARRSIAGELACSGLTDADERYTIDVSGTFEAGGGDG